MTTKQTTIGTQNKILVGAFVILTILYFVISARKVPETPAASHSPPSADTLIPAGYVLVPVALSNQDAVAGLIENYGLVDLYSGNIRVGAQLKLLKAPLNPNQYAVLIPEAASAELMKYPQPFFAVIQNRKMSAAEAPRPAASVAKTPAPTPPLEIEYYKGEEK